MTFGILIHFHGEAQFYTGYEQKFGKNRVQYEDFLWTYYKFDEYNVYYTTGGDKLAEYVGREAQNTLYDFAVKYKYFPDDKVHFIVFNKIEHFYQSNIGLKEEDAVEIAGISNSLGSKVFVYYNGFHADLSRQVKSGIAKIMIQNLLYGSSWTEAIKNGAFLSLPDWYINGLESFLSDEWNSDIENFARDMVETGNFKKINRLGGEEAKKIGHLIWYYVAYTYGHDVIPNILYMTRVSRNVESGFLFVLGASFQSLITDAQKFYETKFRGQVFNDSFEELSEEIKIRKLKKKNLSFYHPVKSPDGQYMAFASNDMGLIKIYLTDMQTGKTKTLFKHGHRLLRISENNYPVLAWHPDGKTLTFIYENKGKILINFYNVDDKKIATKEMFKLEKVLEAKYLPDGKKMFLTGVKNGKTDIYLYSVISNNPVPVTNDYFDNFNPDYYPENSSVILFSSNRNNDTLSKINENQELLSNNYDIFEYSLTDSRQTLIKRIINTPKISENQPLYLSSQEFIYLSNEKGIINRFVAKIDSQIAYIDTAIHYRYFANTAPLTNYSRNILSHQLTDKNHVLESIYKNHTYRLFETPVKMASGMSSSPKNNTSAENNRSNTTKEDTKTTTEEMSYVTPEMLLTYIDTTQKKNQPVNIKKYTFTGEESQRKPVSDNPKKPIEIEQTGIGLPKQPFTLSRKFDYHTAFAYSNIQSDINYAYENETYQYFNGGPYIKPQVGTTVKIELNNLFEDYKITGGLRFSFNRSSTEYFLSLDNRKKRWDKHYETIYQIQRYAQDIKVNTASFKIQYDYIINEVARIELTARPRIDKRIYLASNPVYLEIPNYSIAWFNTKAAFVFDNSIPLGLNLYRGIRAKAFFENMNDVYEQQGKEVLTDFSLKPEIYITGLDFRHYLKIHRELILASRLAASTSFGQAKLIYYLGGLDNWITRADAPIFNYDTRIDYSQNYVFQTVATNMRGFIQNTRNGNSFVLINNEIRLPIIKYLFRRPIKSDFLKNFQITLFNDIGTAWTGKSPYSDENAFNSTIIKDGPVRVILKNRSEPIVSSFGFGLRSRLLGYFLKMDVAWGIEDYQINRPVAQFSFGYDF